MSTFKSNYSPKFLVLSQARIGSTRLPGKVLLSANGKPLIVHLAERIRAAKTPLKFMVILPDSSEDDILAKVLEDYEIDYFRGHPTDLLDRHWKAAENEDCDAVVKIPSDCPLIDPNVIDRVLTSAGKLWGTYDFFSNLHPQSYPDGNDVEVIPKGVLQRVWSEATLPYEREHTTPYLWMNPKKFRIVNSECPERRDFSKSHRYTLDYETDYQVILSILNHFNNRIDFTYQEIINFLNHHPSVQGLNASHLGYTWYDKISLGVASGQ